MDERQLEGFLDFTDEDLAANRGGALSPGQVGRLRTSGISLLVVGPALTIVAGLLALLVMIDNALFTVMFLGAAALGLYATWKGFAFLVDGNQGAVAYVTGPLHLKAVRTRYGMSYSATIGPVSKQITQAAYNSLPRDAALHLYYAPGCRSLLSVEPASADEPRPAHPFGPDSAHAWDRVRAAWVAVTVGVLGLLVAAHAVAVAHPASTYKVGGTISDYRESHGKSGTSRYVYLRGDTNSYSPQQEYTYDPPLAPFATLIGREVVLFVNRGTRDVLAVDDGDQLHTAYWYEHPEAQKQFETVNGLISGAVSLIALLGGVIGLLIARVRPSTALTAKPVADPRLSQTPMYSGPSLYVPPSVQPWHANWPAAVLLVAVGITVALGLTLATHR